MDEFWRLILGLTVVGISIWTVVLGGLYVGGNYAPGLVGGPAGTPEPVTSPSPVVTAAETLEPTPTPTTAATPTGTPTLTPTQTPLPAVEDSDGDGLADDREERLGTDPHDRDTDGDNIPDGVEVRGETYSGVPLPNADPLRMDLYLLTYWSLEANPPYNYENLSEWFGAMPVENPDGSSGITLHVERGGLVQRPLFYDGTDESSDEIFAAVDRKEYHHELVVVQFEDVPEPGAASTPGTRVLIDEAAPEEQAPMIVVHQLLHNVIGTIEAPGACRGDPIHYCDGGYMEPRQRNRAFYLPVALADEIEEDGFEP